MFDGNLYEHVKIWQDEEVSQEESDIWEGSAPEHYSQGVSPYDVIKSMFGPEGLQWYVIGNAVKYIQRYPHKYAGEPESQLQDLLKARNSIETAIELHREIHDLDIRHG